MLEIDLGGRGRVDFGTVRPRVQIPGPRPISEYDPDVTAHAAMAMDHSWITISPGGGTPDVSRKPSWPPRHRSRLDACVRFSASETNLLRQISFTSSERLGSGEFELRTTIVMLRIALRKLRP